jgi:rubredoxin
MAADNHGSCKNCGFDLNGERVYDYFLREYSGDTKKAAETASMYGCREGYGRFGKEILIKSYDKDFKKLPSKFACPECREECY